MDGSRVVGRCLQQLHRWPKSSLHVSTKSCSHRRITVHSASKQISTTSRSFSTSSPTRQDEQLRPPPSSQSASQTIPLPQRAAPSTQAEPRTRTTTITANPSSSSPRSQPTSNRKGELGASALAALERIMAQSRARAEADAKGTPLSSSQKPSRPMSNQDLYGRGGFVAQRSAESSSSPASPSRFNAGFDMSKLIDNLGNNTSIFGTLAEEKRPEDTFLRLKPTLGKSVDVDESRGIELTRAFQYLETRINKNGNKVRQEAKDQTFHMRKGVEKKMLRRKRWRTLFKAGFMGECATVRRMIRQGW